RIIDLDRIVEEASVRPDLPEGRPGGPVDLEGDVLLVEQLQHVEPSVARVEEPEAVAPRLYAQKWPALAIHRDDVAEKLGNPERMVVGVGRPTVQSGGVVRRRAVREKDLAVRVELPVLQHQLDLLGSRGQRDRVGGETGVAAIA